MKILVISSEGFIPLGIIKQFLKDKSIFTVRIDNFYIKKQGNRTFEEGILKL